MEWLDAIITKFPKRFFVVFGFFLYFYSLFNGFVGDDFDQLVNNAFIHSITHIPYFFLGGTFNNGFVSLSGIYYKPLMTICFSIIYTLFGLTPFFYHLLQVTLHITNTILVFYLFKKFFTQYSSFFAALIFLIHPINTEAVVYISNLQDVLFTFFGLSALLLLIYKEHILKNLLLTTLLLFLSLLSKETGIVFIALSISYLLLYSKKNFIKQLSFSLIVVGIYLFLRIHAVGVYKYQTENFPMIKLSLSERLLNIPSIIFYYLKTFLFPIHLAFDQNWIVKTISFNNFYFPLIIILMIAGAFILFALSISKKSKLKKEFLFFLGFVIFGLFMHLQILPLDMTVADRWFYVPSIGVIGIITLAVTKLIKNKKIITALPYALSCLVIGFFVLTFLRSLNWQNQYELYGHDVKYNQDSFSLLNGWGLELMNVGKYQEAEPYIKKSIAIEPNFCYSWNNLGSIYIYKKDFVKAREYYQNAINKQGCPLAYNNLSTLLYYHFTENDAYTFTKNALKEVPNSPRLWLMMALIQHKKGNDAEALTDARRSYQLNPSSAAAYVYQNLLNKKEFDLKES